ncbi:fasciclin domain-containing protein [Sphingobacterium bovistauri]|uniref:Fasciclin domain-containing protein n=1 Tax=Sphingobacterium bovistauri TaxID=2781959 RepID=A0ABS7Z2Q8_9SPHI|nr:fasciclin domain-containing protein [Sphingobacterium bovistauri]MCA5003867.1 fasciclin domain-containing protein [Sphingobacterium bovistauri]
MKNIILIWTAMMMFLIIGCQKKWPDHYSLVENSDVKSSLTLLEYLKTKPEYSKFVEKLVQYGLDKELTRDQTLTVWVVNNDRMNQLASLGYEEEYIMKFHINSLVFDENKLKTGLRLMTLNGKYLTVDINQDQVRVSEGIIVKGNQLCKNGVIHEIDKLLKPDVSIYDYVSSLDDSHSIIRDTILAMNDTIFDIANSVPIGVDRTGNTLYDSVFVISNPIFQRANIISEFDNATMFLPSNEVMNDCFQNLGQLYSQFGKQFLKADSQIAYSWIKEAIFYNKVIEDYGTSDITSAYGRLWKPNVQQVDPNFMRMSNGRIYKVNKLKIPNNVHIKMIKQLFHYYEYVPANEKEQLFKAYNVTSIGPVDRDNVNFATLGFRWIYRVLQYMGDRNDGEPAALDFTAIMLETTPTGETKHKVVEVPPGEYNLYLGFRASAHPYVNVYFNDELVRGGINVSQSNPWNYDRNTNTSPANWNGWGGLVGIVKVEGDQMSSFRIKIEYSSGNTETLQPYHWTLVPTANNY